MGTSMSEIGKALIGGYVYVIGFESGVVKVGHTVDPRTRLSGIVGAARTFGDAYTGSWLSPRHLTYKKNERALIDAVKAAGGRSNQREYFTGVTFACAVSLAQALTYPQFDEQEELVKAGPSGAALRTRILDHTREQVEVNPDHPLAQFFPEARERGLAARAAGIDAALVAVVIQRLLPTLSIADNLDVLSECLNQLITRGDELIFEGSTIQSNWADVEKDAGGKYRPVYYDVKIAEMASEPAGGAA